MKKILFLLFIFPIIMISQFVNTPEEDLLINRGVNIDAPLILENSILFYYRGKAKEVILSGEFNNWQDNYYMIETKTNLWTISWTNRLDPGTYKYRLKVDGFWISDPENPNFIYDQGNQKLSLITLDNTFSPHKKYPYWLSNNVYVFRHHSTNVKSVHIAGDFNNWNPYSLPMKYLGAGDFEIQIELTEKKIYTYSFIEDGTWTFDKNNKKQFRNNLDRPVSSFYADKKNSKP